MSDTITEGAPAPDFSAIDQSGTEHALSDYRGRKVVLFFYPRDMTPGCTTEACDFRDNYARLTAKDVALFGVSTDSMESHQKFDDKHDLGYPLLVDADGTMAERYGAWVEKSMFGKKFNGVRRSTFIIDEEGRVEKVWPNVKVTGHVDEVLDALGA